MHLMLLPLLSPRTLKDTSSKVGISRCFLSTLFRAVGLFSPQGLTHARLVLYHGATPQPSFFFF